MDTMHRQSSMLGRVLLAALLAVAPVFLESLPSVAATDPEHREESNTWFLPRSLDLDSPDRIPANRGETGQPFRDALRDHPWQFSPNLQVHPIEGGQHIWPDIAIAPDGTISVAWMDDHAAGGYRIFYCRSTDEGATWSTPERVDTRVTGSYSKFVDIDLTPSGIPVAVWEDDRAGVYNVFLSKRDPAGGGTPWTPEVRVNTTGGSSQHGSFMNPSLAVLDEQRYFVAWTDWREGVFHQVYMRATSDGGATWGVEARVSDGLGYQPVAGDPCLIVDPASLPPAARLYCVTNDWRGNVPGGRYPNVYFHRSTNGGATWSIGVQVNDVEPYYQQVSSHALVLLSDGALTAGWLNNPDFTQSHLHVCVSTDQGATWGASVRVDEPSAGGTGTYSSIASHGNWLFAAMDIYETNWNAYFRASSDGGRTWSESMVRMDDDASESPTANPVVVAVSAGHVCAVWQDGRPYPSNWKIYASSGRSLAAGVDDLADGKRAAGRIHAFPNPPHHGDVQLILSGNRVAGATAGIYGVDGTRIGTVRWAGPHASWDGRDRSGALAPNGTYWIRLDGDARTAARIVRVR